MQFEQLRREALRAQRSVDSLQSAGALRQLSMLNLQPAFDASEVLKQLSGFQASELLDRRRIASMARVDKVVDLQAGLPSVPEMLSAATIVDQYRADLTRFADLAQQTVFSPSITRAHEQLEAIVRESLTWAPPDLAWTVLTEEIKLWPAQLGVSGVLKSPTQEWIAESVKASAAWAVPAAELLRSVDRHQMAAIESWAQQLAVRFSRTQALRDINDLGAQVDQLLSSLPAVFTKDWTDEALGVLEGLTPEARDHTAESAAIRRIVVGIMFLLLVAAILMPQGDKAAVAAGEELVETADLIVDGAIDLGADLADTQIVKATSTGTLLWTAWTIVDQLALRRSDDEDDPDTPPDRPDPSL